MKISETKEICNQIPDEHMPLMKMIDKKIDNDMERVLRKMDSLKTEIKGEMGTIKGEMGTMHKLLWTIIYTLLGIILAGGISLAIANYFNHR